MGILPEIVLCRAFPAGQVEGMDEWDESLAKLAAFGIVLCFDRGG
jgi:hypothetical protein